VVVPVVPVVVGVVDVVEVVSVVPVVVCVVVGEVVVVVVAVVVGIEVEVLAVVLDDDVVLSLPLFAAITASATPSPMTTAISAAMATLTPVLIPPGGRP
jgi:hypothetical protein